MSFITFTLILVMLFVAFFAAEWYYIGTYADERMHPTYNATPEQLLMGVEYNGGQNGMIIRTGGRKTGTDIVLDRKVYVAPRLFIAFYKEVPAV